MLGDRSAREAMVREHPRFGVAAWEMFRAIDSYTDVHYFTKVVQSYVDTEGERFLTRFRLRDPRRPEDAGFLDAGSALLPPDRTSRAPGDERSRTFLHDELRRRIGDEGIDLLLELQVRAVPADPAERDDAPTLACLDRGRASVARGGAHPSAPRRGQRAGRAGLQPGNAPRELAMLPRTHRRRSRLAQPPAVDRLRGGGCGAREGALAALASRSSVSDISSAAPARAPAQGGGRRRRRPGSGGA
jgi:hypothetical protein